MRAPLSSWVITVKVMELQKSLLETWKFFSRFFNTLTTDDKYSLISSDNWMQTIQIHLCQKQKIFSQFFLHFSNLHWISNIFKKRWASSLMYFQNYRPRKTCLDKCLTGPVWEDSLTGDMVNGLTHWLNLNESAFIILSDHCEGNLVPNVTLRDVKILCSFS